MLLDQVRRLTREDGEQHKPHAVHEMPVNAECKADEEEEKAGEAVQQTDHLVIGRKQMFEEQLLSIL